MATELKLLVKKPNVEAYLKSAGLLTEKVIQQHPVKKCKCKVHKVH
jgi:hypothetical protein